MYGGHSAIQLQAGATSTPVETQVAENPVVGPLLQNLHGLPIFATWASWQRVIAVALLRKTPMMASVYWLWSF